MRFNTALCLCVAGVILINIAGSFCQSDVCGRVSLNTRIAGGGDSPEGSWPWQVSLYTSLGGNFYCGGTLISKRWVLTAAHCLRGININNTVIYLGRQSRTGSNPNEINRRVSQVIQHPRYDSVTKDNDITLLQLSSTVNYTDYIKPVCLAGANSTFAANTNSWVTGWGKLTADSSQLANVLQEVAVPIINDSVCQNSCYKQITENMICAGWLIQGGADACQGDSGGPLVNKKGSQWIQSGIVSFGRGCDEMCTPGVYTKVSKYQSWIKSSTTGDQPGFVDFISSASSFNRDKFNSFLFSLSLTFSIIFLKILF